MTDDTGVGRPPPETAAIETLLTCYQQPDDGTQRGALGDTAVESERSRAAIVDQTDTRN